jgi:molecular chaperone GrpE
MADIDETHDEVDVPSEDETGAEVLEDGAPEAEQDDGPVLVELDPRDARIEELETQHSELQARLRAVSKAYQEKQDEIAATKSRLERQAAVKEELRRGEVVATLFEPVQNLRRSLDAARKGASTEDTIGGLEIVIHQFMDSFGKLGLEEVPGQGSRFDPNLHEALTTIPVADESLDQVVMEVFSAGYRIGSRLIAPAKVIVGSYTAPVGEA